MDKPGPESYDNKPLIEKPAYAIIGCNKLKELPLLVNVEVADGYEPIGQPFYEPTWDTWCQTIYKRPQIVRPIDIPAPQLRKAR